MPNYFYRAYTMRGENKEGVVEAEDRLQAFKKIDSLSLFPLRIELIGDNKKGRDGVKKIKSKSIAVFTRQISNLLEAGIAILGALTIIRKQRHNFSLGPVLDNLIKDLKEGASFSEALAKRRHIFLNLYVSLVRAGEAGGCLEETMSRLADFMENEEEVKTKIKAAMFYPVLIAAVGLITVFVLIGFVMPRIVLVFEDLGQALPLPTRLLINASNLVSAYWWLIALALVLVFFTINRMMNNPQGRDLFDKLKFRMPFLGAIIFKREVERFCRFLSVLLSSGITIMPALEIIEDMAVNSIFKKDIEGVKLSVRDGSSLANAMAESKCFPASISDMIDIGEETGSLEDILKKISHSYDREIEQALKVFISLLEPFMILAMGLAVAFIMVAMLLPIFEINFIQGG